MKENKEQSNSALVTLESRAKQLDVVAEKFSNALAVSDSPFSSALTLSQGITALRELLDDGIMGEIMKLANTPLGFLTDRGPTSKAEPYKMHEVRDAIIEASLRGFRVAGNEFNIIASRFYGAKAGLHRRVITYPGVTDFKEMLGVPKLAGDKGAVVNAGATWKKDGIKDEFTGEFAIKVNTFQGVDAILGKCQRKLYAAVLNQLSGIVTPEGEVDDTPTARPLPMRPAEFKKEKADDKAVSDAVPTSPEIKPASADSIDAVQPDPTSQRASSIVDDLSALLAKEKVMTTEVITALIEHAQPVGDATETGSLADLPDDTIKKAIKQFGTLIFTIHKNRQKSASQGPSADDVDDIVV